MALPLEGLRILAVSQFGAGPFGTLMLADLGAEVIKIEDPGTRGDVSRTVPPYQIEDDSLYFQCFNRNKRSLQLNLDSPEGMAIFHNLVKISDAVFNNLRGDVPAKLGLTYDSLKEYNPEIVCCSLSAYGRTGSEAKNPGYDPLLQAAVGYMSVTGEPDATPSKCGVSVIDFSAGYAAMFGLMTGIYAAQRTGIGRDVDVSLEDTALSMLNYFAVWYLNRGIVPERLERSSHSALVPCQNFPTRDGHIVIFCAKEKFWKLLCEAINRPDLASDPRFVDFSARLKNKSLLIPILDEIVREKTSDEWMRILTGKVPCAPVRTIPQALDDPRVAANGMIAEYEHPEFGTVREVGCPVKVSGSTPEYRAAPKLGQDTEDILTQYLGFSQEKIQALQNDGIV